MKNVENIYPLSPMQQGMLFHALYAPESDVYLVQLVRRLHGELSVSIFKSAWQLVADRHAVLRTSFLWENLDEPLQVVRKQLSLPWEELDLRGCSPSRREEQIEHYLRADRERGFVLSGPPVMRLSLIQLADDTYEFICTYHHILMDGWSISQVFDEVFTAYQALNHGQQPSFEAVYPFSDYIGWLQKRDMAAAEKFWRHTLRGFTAPTPPFGALPEGGSAGQRDSYHEQQLRLSSGVTAALQSLARQHKLTMNTLVQGGWAILLSRYSGEEDIVFGATVAGRPAELPGAASMVGLFINTLPVRVRIASEESLLCWLEKLQEQQVDQRQYEYSPLVAVQEWSDIPRGLPLFESLLVFENYPADNSFASQITGLKIAPLRGIERTHYPITLVAEPGKELLLKISYNRLRLDDSVITRMLGHLETLLQGITEKPGARVTELPLLTQPEREQLLVEWNQTDSEYPKNRCIHELFEEQVKRTPERVAIAYGDEQLTYDELNRRSNQLAHYLRKFGVGSEVLVGIFMERSVEMIVGLLGILKAGGAYVPLDPAFPNQRLSLMIEDARIVVLLTQQRFVAERPLHAAKTVKLDADWHIIASESADNPMYSGRTEDLAYVIYTSGSTGKPKGVQVGHRALTNLLCSMRDEPGMTSEDVLLSVTTLSFDIAALELYLPLIVGGRLVIASREVASDGMLLMQSLADTGTTVMQATPATWRMLIEAGWQVSRRLKILCGGEALSRELANELVEKSSVLWNMYGPSETTIWSATCRVGPDTGPVSIGGPIANTQIYILDAHLNPLPVGVAGELHIGGDGLARGYLNQPELTAEKLIANPFSERQGERLYKTGDHARYLPDGTIEYLGRIDNQIKLRGFRIELGEIESVVTRHPGVRQCVVLVREDEPEQKFLVGYVVTAENESPSLSELRSFLKEKLPEYMIPSAFVELAELPLTPSGKVDRRALPAPDQSRPELEAGFVAPRTPIEELLASVWAAVLKLDRVGIRDNFFELGGHSLIATRVVSQIRQALHVDLPLRTLFESPTVAELREKIESLLNEGESQKVPAIEPVSRDRELPLSFAQQQLWFLDQLEPGNLAYNFPWAMRLKGTVDIESLQRSLNAIVSRHDILRTTFSNNNGRAVQVIATSSLVALPIVDLSLTPEAEREEEATLLAKQQWQRPFDLARGPLMRVSLLRLTGEEHLLLLTTHHIINDGWSTSVFFHELSALYNAFTTGNQPSLPELPVQYADYAWWQYQCLSGTALEKPLGYWRRQLHGAPEVIQLPTDRPRPSVRSFRGASLPLAISRETTHGVKDLCRSERTTLFMTLLAAYQTLLWWYAGDEDVVVGSPSAGRSRKETEALIGHFVNSLVLRTNLSGNPEFREALLRVREVTLGALAHQDVPFEKLVEELRPERSLSYNPLFQVWFVLRDAKQETLNLKHLTVEPVEIENQSARHELQLTLWESENGLKGSLTYSTDLFYTATIAHMARQFETLLATVVAQPDIRLQALRATLDEADREYRSGLARSLEQASREKLKATRRKSITATHLNVTQELLKRPNP